MTSLVLSKSLQDYLEVILRLSEQEENVRITDIADKLQIAKASVTQAIGTLKDLELVMQERYGPIRLTEKGKVEAGKVWYRHQILYDFLANILQVEPAIAEKDACLMEHIVSPQTMEQLVRFLDYKKNAGDNVADKALSEQDAEIRSLISSLNELSAGDQGRVIRVTGSGALRRRILEMGVIPGIEIRLERLAPLGDPIEINIKGSHLSLRKEEAASIYLEVY